MATGAARRHPPPDFVIPGAPRSGTTFMYEYLARHPQIYMSPVKEPNFFGTDLDSGSYLDSLSFTRDRARYMALYERARPDQLTGEATTWYLYSKDAAASIHAHNPEARAVIMLREPVAMLHSLHLRRVYGGSEDLPRFEDALDAEADRREGRRLSPKARNVKGLLYRAVGCYSEQVERFFDILGRDRVLVLIFEEFRRDSAASYRQVLEFLGVDPEFRPDFAVVNAGMARRSWRLQQMLLSPTVVKAARRVIPVRLRPAVGRAWDRINSRAEKPAPLDVAVAARLRAELQPDIDRLGQLLGRDLREIWPSPAAAA
ncbi:MAG TPA: sulfotransferase [Candidatus Limnocylindrales bacterium]|nr:sulfotransferase [Candidatus Limnocylindrales bacterium]